MQWIAIPNTLFEKSDILTKINYTPKMYSQKIHLDVVIREGEIVNNLIWTTSWYQIFPRKMEENLALEHRLM